MPRKNSPASASTPVPVPPPAPAPVSEDLLLAMKTFMEEMTKGFMEEMQRVIKTSFDRQLEALQAEFFDMKRDLDREREKRKRLEEENYELRIEVKQLSIEVDGVLEKMDSEDQEKRRNDVVLENLETQEVSDAKGFFVTEVNKNLMGKIIEESDVERVVVLKNRYNSSKMTLIATMKAEMNKNAILSQKKMFREKNIYAKENLTKHRYNLFKQARIIAKEKDFKFVWTKSGNIYIRKNESARVVQVTNISVLNDL